MSKRKKASRKNASARHTLVTGHSGAGKSTLANSFGLPIHALDDDPDIRERLSEQMAYARANDGRLPLGAQYKKRMQEAERKALNRAFALKDPHVIEGSYLLNRDPEELKEHDMHLVDTPENTVLERRVERQRKKDLARNRHWDDDRAAGVRSRGQQLIDEYAPGVKAWRSADYVKKAALQSQEDIFRALKGRMPRGAHHVSGGLPDARGPSDVDIYLPRKKFTGLESRFPEGTSVAKQGDDHAIYSIPGFDREVNVYATSNPAKRESIDHRRTMMELAKKYPQLERKALAIKAKGKGSEPAWAEVLGLEGDPYEVMANTGEVMRHASQIKKAALNKTVELRPHQKDALRALHEGQGRALFAHGTGTGKTLTSIASFEDLRSKGKAKRALVVAPASLLTNFREQGVQKFTDSSVSAIGGGGDYQLVSLEKFRRDPQTVLDKADADTLIIDEMHRSRNPRSSSFEALRTATRDARIKNVVGLTGSIVSNHPQDIVPLADLIRNKHGLGSRQAFTKEHVKVKKISGGFLKPPSTKYDLYKKDALRGKVDGLIHYVGNNDMEGMPALKVNDVHVQMSEEQQKLYDFAMGKLNPAARARIRSGLPPSQSEAQHIFGTITKLRQASNSIGTHKNVSAAEAAESTPKLRRVLDDVQDHIKTTRDGQAVVYSNLVNGGARELYEGLRDRGINAGLYTGPNKELGVTKASRDDAVRRFTAGKDRAIILTGAGGEGLSLNNATMFAAVDPHFNPEKNWQAVARARRFGGLSHRPKEDRVIQVNRYRSSPRQSYLGKAIFGKEVGVDEWMQRVADEKDRLNAQVRTISQNVTDRGKKEE
jgi:SNF2 family DNA or RNA helicase